MRSPVGRGGPPGLGPLNASREAMGAAGAVPDGWIRVRKNGGETLRERACGRKCVVERGRVPAARLVVDLRALQLAAEIDVDALPLGERVEHRVAGLAVA